MKKWWVWGAAIALGILAGRLAADATYREGRDLSQKNADLYQRTASEEEKLSKLKRTVNVEKRNYLPGPGRDSEEPRGR